jgi:preprotein translocase subunit SecG
MFITVASLLGGILGTLFFLVALFMILVVLIQKPKGGGLSGAFGAGGGGGGDQQAMFGAKVGDVLTIITVCCFVAFILLAISLVYVGQQSAVAEPTDPPQAVGDVPVDEDPTPEPGAEQAPAGAASDGADVADEPNADGE